MYIVKIIIYQSFDKFYLFKKIKQYKIKNIIVFVININKK